MSDLPTLSKEDWKNIDEAILKAASQPSPRALSKLYLQSGQFQSMLKTSENLTGISSKGISWDESDSPWVGDRDDTLHLLPPPEEAPHVVIKEIINFDECIGNESKWANAMAPIGAWIIIYGVICAAVCILIMKT